MSASSAAAAPAATARQRARALGMGPGILSPGPLNAITDVEGVLVGHCTLVEGDSLRTGVTVIMPHGGNVFQEKVPAAIELGNGFGKLAGYPQVRELGNIETPIALTNTLGVGAALEGLILHTLGQPGNETVRSVNGVVGETNDGFLNDIRRLAVRPEHVLEAIEAATSGAVVEGSVGAGTGTSAFGYKGGIGTASRRLTAADGGFTVGVLVQSNYDGILMICGAPVGRELKALSLGECATLPDAVAGMAEPEALGSCMMVVATDAPLDARNLQRLARRALIGMGRTGSVLQNGSGDFVIAFSTAWRIKDPGPNLESPVALLANRAMDDLFLACAEATEEALYNSLFMATPVTGRDGHHREAIPLDRVVEIARKYNVIDVDCRLRGAQE